VSTAKTRPNAASRERTPAPPARATEQAGADEAHAAYVAAWERVHPGQPFPSPWQSERDAAGWNVAARGKNWPARPDANVEVPVILAPDDYVWLARQAQAAGLLPSEYVSRLVTEARTVGASNSRQAESPAPQ
jgi:hypothetical protein